MLLHMRAMETNTQTVSLHPLMSAHSKYGRVYGRVQATRSLDSCTYMLKECLKNDFMSLFIIEPRHDISNNVVCATSKGSDQPAHTRSLISLCLLLEYDITLKLLAEHHYEFLSLKGGCTDSSESTLVKMPQ